MFFLYFIAYFYIYLGFQLLDYLLGHRHEALFRRAELKTLVNLHGNEVCIRPLWCFWIERKACIKYIDSLSLEVEDLYCICSHLVSSSVCCSLLSNVNNVTEGYLTFFSCGYLDSFTMTLMLPYVVAVPWWIVLY